MNVFKNILEKLLHANVNCLSISLSLALSLFRWNLTNFNNLFLVVLLLRLLGLLSCITDYFVLNSLANIIFLSLPFPFPLTYILSLNQVILKWLFLTQTELYTFFKSKIYS